VQSFYQLWSGELFPTRVRATAHGVTLAIVTPESARASAARREAGQYGQVVRP
jgi:hypothetical protein